MTGLIPKTARHWMIPIAKRWAKGAFGFLASQAAALAHWEALLPIEDEQRVRAVFFWTPLLGIAAVLGTVLFLDAASRLHQLLRRIIYFCSIVLFIGLLIACAYAYHWVDAAWKNPRSDPDFLYWYVEPIVYGLFFALFASFIVAVTALSLDLFVVADNLLGFPVRPPNENQVDQTEAPNTPHEEADGEDVTDL
jgi:hypothetical protein